MARKSSRKDVGAWLGGNRGYLRSGTVSPDTEAKADAGGGQMEQVRAELGLGAYAAGVGAAGAIGAGVAAVRSGAAAKVVNKMTGQTVIIHGTNVRGLKAAGQQLMTNVPPARPEVGKVLFGVRASERYGPEELARIMQHYASTRSFQKNTGSKLDGVGVDRIVKEWKGSAYVAKVPKKSLQGEGQTFVRSSSPGKIVAEIPVSGTSHKLQPQFQKDLEKAYKRAGGKFPKAPKQKKYKEPKNQPPVRS